MIPLRSGDFYPENQTSLSMAQYRAFANKMPAFYLSIAASKVATCCTFYDVGPNWMCWGVGGGSLFACVARAVWWISHRDDPITGEDAARALKVATARLVVTTLLFIGCDIVFYQYGDTNERTLLLFIQLSTYMCSFFCLMHLRFAVLSISGIILFAFLALLLHDKTPTSWAILCNLVAVIATMIFVMESYIKDFRILVGSKALVERQRTETERLSEDNLRLANLDMLTDLPNRRRFFDDLYAQQDAARARRHNLGVGVLDLDGFKPINDLHGHAIGDRLLRSVAERLEEVAGGADITVYRIGGDEFAFLVAAPLSDGVLVGLGERIIVAISQPVSIGELVASVGCSIGFATLSGPTEAPDQIYERADYALYHAKRNGRGQVVMFAQEHEQIIKTQRVVANTLRNADLDQELHLAFQPIVAVASGRTTAFECLARWRSPALGDVAPGTFIIVAEQSGMMTSLTPILLRKALAIAATWPDSVRMSFNLSAHDIASAERMRGLLAIIEASGFDPSRIDMELTETALACNFDLAFAHMMMLKAVGIRIALDDFGVGYSSISHIHALPLDKIKIDRSFVKGLGRDANSHKIVKSLLALCRDMGLECTVEGVETAAQLDDLTAMECALIQGFYFAKPMAADEIAAYLHRTPARLERARQVAA